MSKLTNKEKADICLNALLGDNTETINFWWNSPNKGLDGKIPLELWESGVHGQTLVLAYLFLFLQR